MNRETFTILYFFPILVPIDTFQIVLPTFIWQVGWVFNVGQCFWSRVSWQRYPFLYMDILTLEFWAKYGASFIFAKVQADPASAACPAQSCSLAMTSIAVAAGFCDAFLCLRVEAALSSWVEKAKGTVQSACHLSVADAGLHTRLRHCPVWRLSNMDPLDGRSTLWLSCEHRCERTKIERLPNVRNHQEGQGKENAARSLLNIATVSAAMLEQRIIAPRRHTALWPTSKKHPPSHRGLMETCYALLPYSVQPRQASSLSFWPCLSASTTPTSDEGTEVPHLPDDASSGKWHAVYQQSAQRSTACRTSSPPQSEQRPPDSPMPRVTKPPKS